MEELLDVLEKIFGILFVSALTIFAFVYGTYLLIYIFFYKKATAKVLRVERGFPGEDYDYFNYFVEFITDNGKTIQGWVYNVGDEYKVGELIEVKYNPKKPNKIDKVNKLFITSFFLSVYPLACFLLIYAIINLYRYIAEKGIINKIFSIFK